MTAGSTDDTPGGPADVTADFARLLRSARDGTVDWFTVADAVGAHLVPARCDWCMVHIRATVMDAVRAGKPVPAAPAVPEPTAGEALEMVTLRHRTGAGEAQLRAHVHEFPPVVGDAYGAGRVALTGATRYTPHVDPAQIRTVAASAQQLSSLRELGLASTIVAPLRTDTGLLLGTLAVGNYLGVDAVLTDADVHHAENLATITALALCSSLPASVDDSRPQGLTPHSPVWRPADGTDLGTGSAVRGWARAALPEVLYGPPHPDFYADLDLLISELASNAIRHGGGLAEVRLSATGAGVRVSVADHDPRAPIVRPRVGLRPTGTLEEGGRGMHLVTALAHDWGVERRLDARGKCVWFELTLQPTLIPLDTADAAA